MKVIIIGLFFLIGVLLVGVPAVPITSSLMLLLIAAFIAAALAGFSYGASWAIGNDARVERLRSQKKGKS